MPVILNKRIGETPLQTINRLREEKSEYAHSKMGYAGKLDPMAHGALLVLIDEENKEREKYFGLDKEYVFECLFGFETDSFDILGKISKDYRDDLIDFDFKEAETIFKGFLGKQTFEYPPFSSKPAKSLKTGESKILLEWSLLDRLEEVEIPKRDIEIYDIVVKEKRFIKAKSLLSQIQSNLSLLNGEFRQKDIVLKWEALLRDNQKSFPVMKIYLKCSSGTYVRKLCQIVGNEIGTGAISLSIFRKSVGEFSVPDLASELMITK